MIKADLIKQISASTGVDRKTVHKTIDSFMESIIDSVKSRESVYLRGFGSFCLKHRNKKTCRNISENTTIEIPAHDIPVFKPAKKFTNDIKTESQKKY